MTTLRLTAARAKLMEPVPQILGRQRRYGMAKLVFLLMMLVTIMPLANPALGGPPIRVMILDGQSAGPYHDWQHITPVLKRELEIAGLFQVDVVTAPPSNGDFNQFNPDFNKYQAIVLNYDG